MAIELPNEHIEKFAMYTEQEQLVFDIFINQEYKRTFVNEIQINEFCKRIWEKDILSIVEIVPVYREYVEVL